MALTFAFYTDRALSTPASAALAFAQALDSPAPVDRVIWLGSRRADRVARLTGSPGSPIVLTPVGPGAADVRLALSAAGLDSAVPGAPLAIGQQLLGGLDNALAIYLRVLDTQHLLGEKTFSMTLDLTEFAL